MQQEDDSGDEFSDVDEELEASDVDDEALSSDDDDAGEYAAALAELGAARRKAGVDGSDDEGSDDDDGDINADASDSDDEAFEAVTERTTKKGATVYQVTLCPETAPFTTRAAADEFMRPRLRPPYYHERGRVDGVTRISRRCRSTQAEKPTKRPSKESSARYGRRARASASPS